MYYASQINLLIEQSGSEVLLSEQSLGFVILVSKINDSDQTAQLVQSDYSISHMA